jgi:hypothetical protein
MYAYGIMLWELYTGGRGSGFPDNYCKVFGVLQVRICVQLRAVEVIQS